MKAYKCIKEFGLNVVDMNGFCTNDWNTVPVGSIWELNNDVNYMGGENHLQSEGLIWIEIPNEDLKEYFEEVKK